MNNRLKFLERINDLAHLLKSKQTVKNKIKIILTYIKLVLKMLIVDRFLNIREETIFGLNISSFNYQTILQLFREVFVRHEYYFKTTKSAPVIFDCGANIGMATFFFKWLYPQSEIHAFEPDKATFKLLKWNIRQNNLDNVYLHNVALSDKSGPISLYIDKLQPGSTKMSTKFERMPKDQEIVNGYPLSAFIKEKKVDILKMDIEGAEWRVVRELFHTKNIHNIKEMIIEYHHNIRGDDAKLGQFLTLFEENGFDYQLDTRCLPIYSQNKFQDVLIYAYHQ